MFIAKKIYKIFAKPKRKPHILHTQNSKWNYFLTSVAKCLNKKTFIFLLPFFSKLICGIHWFQSPVSAVRTEVSQWFSKFYISWIQRGQKSSLLGHTFCEYFHFIISEWQHLHRFKTKKRHAPVTLPQHMYSIVLKLYFDSEGQTFFVICVSQKA